MYVCTRRESFIYTMKPKSNEDVDELARSETALEVKAGKRLIKLSEV